MSLILIVIIILLALCGWWLSQQQLMAKPWLEVGSFGEAETPPRRAPSEKLGLAVLLGVIGALFALFASAYVMRMASSDWQATPLPRILWVSTGALIVSSLALQLAVVAAREAEIGWVRGALAGGAAAGVAFLMLQWMAWGELRSTGHVLSGNPSSSFFYLMTGIHALHIWGGLVGLARSIAGAWTNASPHRLTLSVEMCAMYWHFLLFIWLLIFALLAGWAGEFVELCRRAFSS